MVTIANACSTYEENKDLNRLPWLANPLLKFVLSKELQELRLKDSWDRETGGSSKTLAKHPDFRIVLVAERRRAMRVQWQNIGMLAPVYSLVGQGFNDWQIAEKLKMSEDSVHRSVSWILYFQNSSTRTDLVQQVVKFEGSGSRPSGDKQ